MSGTNARRAAPEMPAQPPAGAFPDCWTAYGASDDELRACGAEPSLTTGRVWLLLGAQLVLAIALALVVIGAAVIPARVLAALLLVPLVLSATLALLRLAGIASRLALQVDHCALRSPLGRATDLPWNEIAEIGLVTRVGRPMIGLRRRRAAGEQQSIWELVAHPVARSSSDFDWLLVPANGDHAGLSRVLLRYCIDPRARRKLGKAGE